jgi:outer membrane cobalamin receptor
LETLNAVQLSDAVKHFAGASVKDYGGIGGIKTVSVRSLGSTHTAVAIDGVPINDVQTGQIDIGRFSLENVSSISLVNGQSDDIFQPAKLFASASVLNIRSLRSSFPDNKKFRLSGGSRFGSFNFINPYLLYSQKLGERFVFSANAEWMQTDGDYPFTYTNGKSEVHQRRKNSDVQKSHIDASFHGHFSDNDFVQLKLYFYQSEQGLPGAVILEDPNPSLERVWDKNFFVQAHYRNDFAHRFALMINGKCSHSYFSYKNPEGIDNEYYQDEYYLSSAFLYQPLPRLSFSLATDGFFNTLSADLYNFPYPDRFSLLSVLSGKYNSERLLVAASILSTLVNEKVKNGKPAENHSEWSPYVSFLYKPFRSEDFRLRFFYKNIFRLPSFNDLYYTSIGNPDLLPETTNQYNIGLTYRKNLIKRVPFVTLSVDAYYNTVDNKIIATPKRNVLIWSMENVGEVEVKGIDVNVETSVLYTPKRAIFLRFNYSYQEATDANAGSEIYGHQIAYVPRFSGSGNCVIETAWVDISYSLLFSGKRYSAGQNIADNSLPSYTDMSLSLKRIFHYKSIDFSLQAELLNLLDKNYMIVKWYPMAGRSFRISFGVTY